MIIKIIPETEFEKSKMQEEEHRGVKEYFFFGNKKDEDNEMTDFHNWNSSYRYLLGSLSYFLAVITDEQKSKNNREIDMKPINLTLKTNDEIKKQIISDNPDLRIVEVEKE